MPEPEIYESEETNVNRKIIPQTENGERSVWTRSKWHYTSKSAICIKLASRLPSRGWYMLDRVVEGKSNASQQFPIPMTSHMHYSPPVEARPTSPGASLPIFNGRSGVGC
jgi:hypothetical protein